MLQKIASIALLMCVMFSNGCKTDEGIIPDSCGQLDARTTLLIDARAKYNANPNRENCQKYSYVLDLYLAASVKCPTSNRAEQLDAHNALNALKCP